MQAQNVFCAGRAEALVLFVPARSVAATVSESCEIMGPDRRAVVARELTKVPYFILFFKIFRVRAQQHPLHTSGT